MEDEEENVMDTAVVLIVVGVVAVAIFVLLRQFWRWYWKINERNKLLSSINEQASDTKAFRIRARNFML